MPTRASRSPLAWLPLLLAVALLPACRGGGEGLPDVVVLEDGTVLGGRVQVAALRVRRGTEVLVEDDLELVVARDARIDGTLRAVDRDGTLVLRDAPHIRIECGGQLVIGERGAILGGRGAPSSAVGLNGGRGSEIHVSAARLVVDGRLFAGQGGDAGPGGVGGPGGDVLLATRAHLGSGAVRAGEGGRGANVLVRDIFDMPAGSGGDDGSVRVLAPAASR